MTGDPRPARVRVTADPAHAPRTGPLPSRASSPAAREADAVFAQSLVRTQLRLALGCLLGFLLAAGALTAVIVVLGAVAEPAPFGVPLSWLLHAYGYYPVILFFGLVFARSAARNERRYRALLETEREP